jgi:diadenosine tetraphosphate (Ap4A) HIT family hydrolase
MRFRTSTAYLHDDQFFPGWTILVLERHATELWHLERAERGELMEEISTMARALAGEFAAVKVNYELLGNQVGHIHWHLIPRLSTDPIPKQAVWMHEHPPTIPSDAARVERIARLRGRLAAVPGGA